MSENGPRRLLAAVLIRATKDALDANSDLATEARGWLGAVGGDLADVAGHPARAPDGLVGHPAVAARRTIGPARQ